MNIEHVEHLLDTYSFEEILEMNDLTEADVLLYLVEDCFIELPDPEPVE